MENLLRLALPHLSQSALDALWRSAKSLHPAIRAVLLARRAKRRDLSDGQEAVPVLVVNDVDEEPHPAVAYTKCCVCDAALGGISGRHTCGLCKRRMCAAHSAWAGRRCRYVSRNPAACENKCK